MNNLKTALRIRRRWGAQSSCLGGNERGPPWQKRWELLVYAVHITTKPDVAAGRAIEKLLFLNQFRTERVFDNLKT